MNQANPIETNQAKGRWKLLLVLFVCAAPLIFSYLTYYVIKPSGRTNYGTILDPREFPIPQLGTSELDGKPASLNDYKGKWIMLQVGAGACEQACKDQLVAMRQFRLMQGKDMERIERVWLITDATPLDTVTKENTTLYASDRDFFVFLANEKNKIEVPNRRNGRAGSMCSCA